MKIYTKAQAAEALGMVLTTLDYHLRAGHINATVGKVEGTNRPGWQITESDLETFRTDYETGKFSKPGRRRGTVYKKKE